MDDILTQIKKELKAYKDYWDLPREDKLTLEKETFNKIKSGKKIGTLSLGERIKILKEKKEKNKKKSGLVDKPLGAGGTAK